MLRVLLIIAVAFVVPFLAYGLWRVIGAGRAPQEDPDEVRMPVQILLLAGAGLAALTLGTLAVFSADEGREGVYHPPSLEGGKIRPGRFEPENGSVPENEPGEPGTPPR